MFDIIHRQFAVNLDAIQLKIMKQFASLNFFLNLFICLFFIILLYISWNEKNLNYSDKLYNLIKFNSVSDKVHLKKIKINNDNFNVSFIKINNEDKNLSNRLKLKNSNDVLLKRHEERVLLTALTKDEKAINIANNFNIYKYNLLIISSNNYFNNLKFIFSNKEINHQEINNIFKNEELYFKTNKYNEDWVLTKYLFKKRQILNCKSFKDSRSKFKYCHKVYHYKIRNFELPDIIFKKYKYFYFKFDDNFLRFSYEQS